MIRYLFLAFVLTIASTVKAGAFVKSQAEADRYIVIGSYLAEIVVALDGADQIAAVSSGTDHIPELADVPVIPGFRSTSAEAMLAVQPTVALLAGRQTRPEVMSQLSAADVDVHMFPDRVADLDIVPERIRDIGAILGKEQAAERLVESFLSRLSAALAFSQKATSSPRGLFILSGGGRPTVVAGEDTHIALLIKLAGAENVTKGISYFKPMSQEAMLQAAPDFILVNKEGLELKGGFPVALTAPGAALTPAGRSSNIFALPSGYLQGLGLNTPNAIRAIAERVHPELAGRK